MYLSSVWCLLPERCAGSLGCVTPCGLRSGAGLRRKENKTMPGPCCKEQPLQAAVRAQGSPAAFRRAPACAGAARRVSVRGRSCAGSSAAASCGLQGALRRSPKTPWKFNLSAAGRGAGLPALRCHQNERDSPRLSPPPPALAALALRRCRDGDEVTSSRPRRDSG